MSGLLADVSRVDFRESTKPLPRRGRSGSGARRADRSKFEAEPDNNNNDINNRILEYMMPREFLEITRSGFSTVTLTSDIIHLFLSYESSMKKVKATKPLNYMAAL